MTGLSLAQPPHGCLRMVVHEPHAVPPVLPLEHVGPDWSAGLSGENGRMWIWIWVSLADGEIRTF